MFDNCIAHIYTDANCGEKSWLWIFKALPV